MASFDFKGYPNCWSARLFEISENIIQTECAAYKDYCSCPVGSAIFFGKHWR